MNEDVPPAELPDEAGAGARETAADFDALETALRLQRAADALISARAPTDVLDAILGEGLRAADARAGLIATLSDDGEWLDVIASRGYEDRYIDPFRRFSVASDYPLSEAVRTGEGVFLRSAAERDSRYPELIGRSEPGHALVCLPLVGEGGPIGGLVFSFSSDQEFPPERRALKLALARQAALALERAHLAVAEGDLRERLSFLVEATGLLAFDEGVVYALRDVSDEHALERARSDFVATASHELRTPLAAVYGAARTLRRTDIEFPAEQRDRFLEIIVSETERLTAIVSQILLAGQLEEGRVDLTAVATDLRPLAESVLDSARLRAPEQIELRLEQNGNRAVALADEDKLRQVLVNLLDNAIKYSPDGGDVVIELAGGQGRILLTVRDCGLGIPPDEQERIFEKFYRLDPALTRGVGGSGLFISRELVARMGGSLAVRSRPGEGAVFVVDLPAA
jgi:signal transduction histidine kinase